MVPWAGVPTTLGVILNVSTANSTEIVWSALTAAKVYSFAAVISTATLSTLTSLTW